MMGVFVDIFYELGMTYRDVTLFCNICEAEDYFTTSAFESRKRAKKDGWIRKFAKQAKGYVDICPECQKSKKRGKPYRIIGSHFGADKDISTELCPKQQKKPLEP